MFIHTCGDLEQQNNQNICLSKDLGQKPSVFRCFTTVSSAPPANLREPGHAKHQETTSNHSANWPGALFVALVPLVALLLLASVVFWISNVPKSSGIESVARRKIWRNRIHLKQVLQTHLSCSRCGYGWGVYPTLHCDDVNGVGM